MTKTAKRRPVSHLPKSAALAGDRACGIMEGKRFTGFPGTEGKVKGGVPVNQNVIVDGNLITSKGAGTAGEFAVAIIKALLDEEAAETIAERVLLRL